MSKNARDIRLVFNPRRGVKLSIDKSGLTIKIKHKKTVFKKQIDAVVRHFRVDPMIADVVTVDGLLPPDAPIDDLAEKLSARAARILRKLCRSQMHWQ